jgi:hypothetical protein
MCLSITPLPASITIHCDRPKSNGTDLGWFRTVCSFPGGASPEHGKEEGIPTKSIALRGMARARVEELSAEAAAHRTTDLGASWPPAISPACPYRDRMPGRRGPGLGRKEKFKTNAEAASTDEWATYIAAQKLQAALDQRQPPAQSQAEPAIPALYGEPPAAVSVPAPQPSVPPVAPMPAAAPPAAPGTGRGGAIAPARARRRTDRRAAAERKLSGFFTLLQRCVAIGTRWPEVGVKRKTLR